MRVANKTTYDGIIRSLGRAATEMAEASEVVTTTKRINRLSDDPVGLVTVLDLRASIANISQIERNVNMGRSWLTAGESALSQTEEILSKTKELSVQHSSANASSAARRNAVNVVDGYLREVLSLSNSKVGDRYIFGGTNTGTLPFALNSSETQVNYSGNDIPFSIKIGKDNDIAIGRDGEDIYGENWDNNNIFKTLVDLKAYLQGDDVGGIQAAMDKLDSHLQTVRATISDIGGKTIRFDVKERIIEDLESTYAERKSLIEEADIAEAIMNLNSKELAYNAALVSSSKVMKLSLVDYL